MLSIFNMMFAQLRLIYNLVVSWYAFSFVLICSVIAITVKIMRNLGGNNK